MLWCLISRVVAVLVLFLALLLSPVGYIELACREDATPIEHTSTRIIDPPWQRAESRTLLTYPEWHIVHAYDDYARVISDGDPHDFAYSRAIVGFWSALCPLSERAAAMGGATADSKLTIYTIGVSFTVEMAMKALYEETLGRFTTWVRAERSSLDDLTAEQAADYAAFLRQVPWYKYDFLADEAELASAAGSNPRDRERQLALGVEYRAKAAYARIIEQAVAEIGADELRLRSVVTGIERAQLSAIEGVEIIESREDGFLIETDRYHAFTRLLERLAQAGADLVEIAGNDEILFTALSKNEAVNGTLHSFPRQGYGDYRHLFIVDVRNLLERLRNLEGMTLEHVHDY